MIEIQLTSVKDILLIFSMAFAIFLTWVLIWKWIYEVYIKSKEQRAEKKLENAEKKAEYIIQQAYEKANQQLKYIEKLEENLLLKEKHLENKLEQLKKEKEEIEKIKQQQLEELQKITNMSYEDAKKYLFKKIETQEHENILSILKKYKKILNDEISKHTANIIATNLHRINSNLINDLTTTIINIPDESIKGKIIWKNGKNIQFFEKISWVDILIDDTPWIIRLSSFDPEKRFIAEKTIEMLIQDGRINPVYIQQFYEKAKNNLDQFLIEKWEEALTILNIPYLHPDIVRMIGNFYLRYSYWQNLWIHSIEVAQIAELLANELWLDGEIAKKAWLLHDIGKVINENRQTHAKIWADILRKYWLDEIIINAVEGHHMDIEIKNPIWWIIAAADSISASRPWARFFSKNFFLERLKKLENLILSIEGIKQVNIYQAWRQIWVFLDPDKISELEMEKITKQIAKTIQKHIDYPGMVKIITIREKKTTFTLA